MIEAKTTLVTRLQQGITGDYIVINQSLQKYDWYAVLNVLQGILMN